MNKIEIIKTIIDKKIVEDRINNAELAKEGKNDQYYLGKLNAYNEILHLFRDIDEHEKFLEKYGKYLEESEASQNQRLKT